MLMEMAQGKSAQAVAALTKEDLLDELGAPLLDNPARLKCAILGLTTLKVALHKGKGTPLPDGLSPDDFELN